MSDNSILAIAQSGIQKGMTGLKKNAVQLASKDVLRPEGALSAMGSSPAEGSKSARTLSQSSVTNELVEMKMNKYQVLASGKVVQTMDEMLGALLDEKV